MTGATVITMVEGEIVRENADVHFARIEQERTQARHVANLLGLAALHMRQAYLDNLERREGTEAAQRVSAAFIAAWDARRARSC